MQSCKGTITLRCDDNCTILVVDKFVYENELQDDGTRKDDVDFNFSMQDSATIKSGLFLTRLKHALIYLFKNKPVYYNDIYIQDVNKVRKFIEELSELIAEE